MSRVTVEEAVDKIMQHKLNRIQIIIDEFELLIDKPDTEFTETYDYIGIKPIKTYYPNWTSEDFRRAIELLKKRLVKLIKKEKVDYERRHKR